MIFENELPTLLSFDLETSSEFSTWKELQAANPRKAQLWKEKHEKSLGSGKADQWSKFADHESSYSALAPLNAEFGRIVCASFCYLSTVTENSKMKFKGRMKSFYDNNPTVTSEKEILTKVAELLTNITRAGKHMKLTGHNIKKFDVPWLAKRMLINGIAVPSQLQNWGKKPWEVDHVDTGDLWSMGTWDGYVSLDVLTCSLGIPSPKAQMKGEDVGKNFWLHKKYDDIKKYCEEDVKAVVRVCHALSKSELELDFEPSKITT